MSKRLAATAIALALPFAPSAMAQDDPSIVFAVDNLWPTLDPVIGISTTGGRVHSNVFDHLIERNYAEDPDGTELVPGLATEWEQTSPKVWEITIREGVTFQNGEKMDAEDVAFSLSKERLWGEDPIAARGTRYAQGLVRVEQTGPYTVELETEYPDPSFINRLSTPIGFVLPKDYYEEVGTDEFGQKPIGTGPYKITEFDPSDMAKAEAWDGYWGGDQPFSEITWKIVPEYSTRYAGLAAGEYDLIIGIPSDQLETVEATPGVRLVVNQIGNYPAISFNILPDGGMETDEMADNPMADPNLRKALVSAINRPALTEALWEGRTYTPAPFNFPEYGEYYDPDREPTYPFDPEAAAEFLEKSDYDGETLIWHITRGYYDNYEAAAEFMVETWRELGVDVDMRVVDNFSLAYEKPFHMLANSFSSEFTGDPYRPLWLDWGPLSGRVNASHKTWAMTPEFEEAGERFARATEFEEKNQAYLDLVAEWEDVTPGMYLWRNVQSYAMREDLKFDPGNTSVTEFTSDFLEGNDG